jgi:hypothetical protein
VPYTPIQTQSTEAATITPTEAATTTDRWIYAAANATALKFHPKHKKH